LTIPKREHTCFGASSAGRFVASGMAAAPSSFASGQLHYTAKRSGDASSRRRQAKQGATE
jgi:hypothetical protein